MQTKNKVSFVGVHVYEYIIAVPRSAQIQN